MRSAPCVEVDAGSGLLDAEPDVADGGAVAPALEQDLPESVLGRDRALVARVEAFARSFAIRSCRASSVSIPEAMM